MKHTISILCDDTPGVMTRISGLFSRRGFNIESLAVGNTEIKGKSRFTIVVSGDDAVLEQVRKQLQKLVHVIKVWDIDRERIIEREHALVKLEVRDEERPQLLQLVTSLHAKILDSSENIWIIELTGDSASVDSAINLVSQFRILETIRTGRIALERGKKVGNGKGA
ncbi:acetolactate synthase small subunit [Sediminispirochaeta smaragdinae]|jgi:acetolactate synthase-1/3 small subunit|uniref:Acetolactate synthase small subunit n=1 Tax=Sediminispirochaeta smaragdinae (strain DSM 11293 / JCM 15392 / SEBR 4228) TaxID=573413 RepID=E1R8U9_SEDSS|nr:acetolactate synthase small subunit [Sediminispirochaeta smaragdinae]ADK81856.1 acetolactate synthase, small subunit [Sediminispirochaeta smaragdinae DSM 11293]